MTLSFSTVWPERMGELAGQPNYFVEKIWRGLISECYLNSTDYHNAYYDHLNRFGKELSDFDKLFINPKVHTIRYDPHNRWKPGNKIHMVINNRTKNRFQFAPVLECASVQDIKIVYRHIKGGRIANVYIDGHIMSESDVSVIAKNDGFPSVDAFYNWFDENTKSGTKIIHWTNLKY